MTSDEPLCDDGDAREQALFERNPVHVTVGVLVGALLSHGVRLPNGPEKKALQRDLVAVVQQAFERWDRKNDDGSEFRRSG